jgi:hypothetical protein
MGAGRSGTSASSSGSKKSDAEGKGGTSAGGSSSSGGKSPSGGGTGARGPTGAGGAASHTGAKGPAGAPSRSPSPSSPKSGPGGAGGVRTTSQGTRQSQPSARVGGGSILSSPSRVAQSAGVGFRDPRFSDPGVMGVPGGVRGRNQGIMGRTIDVVGAARNRYKDTPFHGMTTPALSQAIAFGDHLRNLGYGPLNLNSAYRSQALQNALKAANPAAVARGDIAKNSQHTLGTAFDASVPGMAPSDLVREALAFGGFGRIRGYGPTGHVHFGTSPVAGGGTIVSGRIAGDYDPRGSLSVGSFAADGRNRAPGLSPDDSPTPGLADAVRTATVDPRGLMANAPRPKPDNFGSMNMAGYRSPMASVGGMPPSPGRMDMAGYQSPMASVGGMPQGRPNMDMGGYNSPMASIGGMPSPKDQARIGAETAPPSQPALASQGPGLLASPNVNLGRPPTPNMNMQGYNSPMAGVGPLPGTPQTAGMSFTPGMPRNPIGGMAFSPGLPGQMSGPNRSRSPFVDDAQQMARYDRPRALGLENYQDEPKVSRANPPLGDLGKPLEPQKSAGLGWRDFVPDTIEQKIDKAVPMLEKGLNWAHFATETPAHRDARLAQGLNGGGHNQNWTGREPPQAVAQMQQHVEQVLRAYLLQMQNAA